MCRPSVLLVYAPQPCLKDFITPHKYDEKYYCMWNVEEKKIKIKKNSPFPFPQSQRRWFSLFPLADPACRIRPARSGKSWTCGGWRAAVSRSVPEQVPLRCGHKHKPAASATRAVKLNPVNKNATHESSAFNQSTFTIHSNIHKSVHTL